MALYLFSTSNHNKRKTYRRISEWLYISFLHQTTTVSSSHEKRIRWLYISFLHQTTTIYAPSSPLADGFISLFYIKPQLWLSSCTCAQYGFISLFYIKPQLNIQERESLAMALYLFSTSNHNLLMIIIMCHIWLYISFLHQTTTGVGAFGGAGDGFISLFYIKPQLEAAQRFTASHGFISLFYIKPQLLESTHQRIKNGFISLFYIKPQLRLCSGLPPAYGFISLFYIKPQQIPQDMLGVKDGFISLFYIKPQRIPYNTLISNDFQYVTYIRSGRVALLTLQKY